jgi:hypothetical protein
MAGSRSLYVIQSFRKVEQKLIILRKSDKSEFYGSIYHPFTLFCPVLVIYSAPIVYCSGHNNYCFVLVNILSHQFYEEL